MNTEDAPVCAVVFDLDGVIVDSEPIWREVEIAIFDRFGADIRPFIGSGHLMGMRVDEVVAYLCEHLSIAQALEDKIVNDVVEGVVRGIKGSATLLPGVFDALSYCDENALLVAIASGSVPVVIDTILERFDLKGHFSVVHSSSDEQFGKPHPSIFLRTALELGVAPEECVVIEDSIKGCIAAKAARMRVIAMPERRFEHDPRFSIADIRITSLKDLRSGPVAELLGLQVPLA